MTRLLVQPFSFACRTANDFHVFFELPSPHRIFCGAVAFQQAINPAFPRAAMLPRSAPSSPGERDVFIAGAVQPELLCLIGQIFPFGLQH